MPVSSGNVPTKVDNHSMFPEAELFVEGERLLGRYTVAIARYSNARWSQTIPPLQMTVTNRRLFIRPQTRKAYQPASIPNTYVTKFQPVELEDRSGIMIALKTGHQLYLYITKEEATRMLDDMSAMKAPPTKIRFDDTIVEQDIQRIIDFVNRL